MKKICIVIYCFIVMLILSSCTTYVFITPVGLWQSDDPQITLNITNEDEEQNQDRDHYGTYIKNGEEIEIYIVFGHVSNLLSVYDAIILDKNFKGTMDEQTLFCGHWEVKDGKLYFTLLPKWQGMYGIKEIVFTKTADY